MPSTMHAVVFDRYGPPDVLRALDRPRPVPGRGEVLVRVAAAGVNPADARFRAGQFRLVIRFKFPFVPGSDVSGVVEAVGAGVTRLAPGDRVFAMLPLRAGGGYAEFVSVPEGLLARVPDHVPLLDAAAVPLAGLTALQALRDKAGVQPGQWVLVYGASGGVGVFAVQIARALGAQVTGLSSARNLGLVRDLGAEALDYARAEVLAGLKGFDVVFDAVNHLGFRRARAMLRPGGVFVTVNPATGGLMPDVLSVLRGGRRVRSVFVEPSGPDLADLATLMERGELRAVIDRTFSLSEAADAHRAVETGRTRGKLVLSVDAALDGADAATREPALTPPHSR